MKLIDAAELVGTNQRVTWKQQPRAPGLNTFRVRIKRVWNNAAVIQLHTGRTVEVSLDDLHLKPSDERALAKRRAKE